MLCVLGVGNLASPVADDALKSLWPLGRQRSLCGAGSRIHSAVQRPSLRVWMCMLQKETQHEDRTVKESKRCPKLRD